MQQCVIRPLSVTSRPFFIALMQGLGGLAGRCTTFHTKHGASFAKWRAVFRAGAHTPSKAAIRRNSKDLASYAAAAQK